MADVIDYSRTASRSFLSFFFYPCSSPSDSVVDRRPEQARLDTLASGAEQKARPSLLCVLRPNLRSCKREPARSCMKPRLWLAPGRVLSIGVEFPSLLSISIFFLILSRKSSSPAVGSFFLITFLLRFVKTFYSKNLEL